MCLASRPSKRCFYINSHERLNGLFVVIFLCSCSLVSKQRFNRFVEDEVRKTISNRLIICKLRFSGCAPSQRKQLGFSLFEDFCPNGINDSFIYITLKSVWLGFSLQISRISRSSSLTSANSSRSLKAAGGIKQKWSIILFYSRQKFPVTLTLCYNSIPKSHLFALRG